MMHVVSLSFIAILLVVLFRQHAEIRELQSQVQTQVHQHRELSAEKCPACEQCSKTKLGTNGVVVAKNYAGVAVTTFLGAPKWFQNRYSMMVNQVLALVEGDWIVQIVYDPAVKMALEGIAYAGIRRQIARGRVILTPIPPSMKKIKKNKLLLSSWFWKSLVRITCSYLAEQQLFVRTHNMKYRTLQVLTISVLRGIRTKAEEGREVSPFESAQLWRHLRCSLKKTLCRASPQAQQERIQ